MDKETPVLAVGDSIVFDTLQEDMDEWIERIQENYPGITIVTADDTQTIIAIGTRFRDGVVKVVEQMEAMEQERKRHASQKTDRPWFRRNQRW